MESDLAAIGARAVMDNLTSERCWALRAYRNSRDHETNRPDASYEASFRWASYEDDGGRLSARVPWQPSYREYPPSTTFSQFAHAPPSQGCFETILRGCMTAGESLDL